jgi:hypothetical protein
MSIGMRLFVTLGRVYRANPFRPHCDAAAGRHVWLCRALGLPDPSSGTGYGYVGSLMMGNDAIPHHSRCPAKGN